MKRLISVLAIAIASTSVQAANVAIMAATTGAHSSRSSEDDGSQGTASNMVPARVATGSRIIQQFTYSTDGATVGCIEVAKGQPLPLNYGECARGRYYIPIQNIPPAGKTFVGHGYVSTKNHVHLIVYWK